MVNYPRRNKTGVRRWIPSFRQFLALGLLGAITSLGLFAYAVRSTTIPTPNEVSQAQTTIIYYDDGVTELGRLGEANRVSVTIDQIPLATQHAILSAEDRDFYKHSGISVKGITRAFWNNINTSTTQGGSTITQQYAKNAYLTQERTKIRKVKEIILAIKLETSTSKDKILEDYLNTIYFGRGAYGIETAANQYFNKDVQALTVAESAVLSAIIQAPNSIMGDEARLKSRFNYVLDGMVTMGWLSQSERDSTTFPTIIEYQQPNVFGGVKGYLVETVRQSLYANGITEDELNRAGYRVTSTFNKLAQDSAEAAVIKEGPKTGTEGLRIGMAAVRPGTGEVVAMYGGADYLKDQLNNATQAIGQAGSTFKPFTLAAALENKQSLSTAYSGKNKTKVDNYVVVNYSDESWGKHITLLKATEHSVNSAYVECAKATGLQKVLDSAVRAGIPADAVGMEPVLAFTLGTASPHVIDIAAGYSTFAARGLQVAPSYLKKVVGIHGDVVFELAPKPVQAYSTDIADTVTYALQKVVTNGTGKPAMKLGRPAAGKTGTTNDNKSALFAGYTPELAAAIMLTKDDANGQPMTLSGTGGMKTVYGASFPARIWTEFMKGALSETPISKFPKLPKGQPNGAKPTATPSSSASPTTPASPKPTQSNSQSPSPSDEPVMVAVPDVSTTGLIMSEAEATNILSSFGFGVDIVDQVVSNPDEYGMVIGQLPAPGDMAPEGSSVTIIVGRQASGLRQLINFIIR